MKIPTILTMLAFSVTVASAQKLKEEQVPSKVKESFQKKYPDTKAKWEKEDADYEAEFKWTNIETSAVFDGNGLFKESEQEIKIVELPEKIKEYCVRNFAGYELKEAAKITEESGIIMYEAEMRKGEEKFDVIFDGKGNFIKKSVL